ncbi:MAG: YceI family protein [Bacteroidales bacterium]|nr:YceI family protein [Bacteroidales bacterium]
MNQWIIDNTHSEVQFKARHLVISTVTGQFTEFEARLEMEGNDLENARAWFSAEVSSISTNNSDRDNHLRSGDFFDAQNHPRIVFESTGFTRKSDSQYLMKGHLTMKGHTEEVVLDVDFGGIMVDPYGNTKAGFEITGKISRRDFGLNWNAVTEAGGVVVGDEIRLVLNIQMVRK